MCVWKDTTMMSWCHIFHPMSPFAHGGFIFEPLLVPSSHTENESEEYLICQKHSRVCGSREQSAILKAVSCLRHRAGTRSGSPTPQGCVKHEQQGGLLGCPHWTPSHQVQLFSNKLGHFITRMFRSSCSFYWGKKLPWYQMPPNCGTSPASDKSIKCIPVNQQWDLLQ